MKGFLLKAALLLTVMLFASCDKLKFGGEEEIDPLDTAAMATCVDAVVNPTFASATEVVDYQTEFIRQYQVDEVFRAMPQQKLLQVATVCINQQFCCSKRDIVEEYIRNRAVYDNLPEAENGISTQLQVLPSSSSADTDTGDKDRRRSPQDESPEAINKDTVRNGI